MKNAMKTIAVTAMVMGSGFATMANADVSTLTCGQFMTEHDDAARLDSAHALLVWIADTANFASVGPLESYKMAATDTADASATDPSKTDTGWTDAEMVISIEAHCFHKPSDTNILARLKEHV